MGDVASRLADVVEGLNRPPFVRPVRVSGLYRTTPMGPDAGATFLNAALAVETAATPRELLQGLQALERAAGRERSAPWQPRPLDLDLLLVNGEIHSSPQLTIPHPHLWYRRFVLDPLVEIAGDVRHPVLEVTLAALRERLWERPLPVAVVGRDAAAATSLAETLRARFPEAVVTTEASGPNTPEPALTLSLDVPRDRSSLRSLRWIELPTLPGSLVAAADSVLTAALDEPILYSRPLLRMP